jgi:ribonuclease HI
MSKYYAVKQGKNPGIYRTWDETKEQVKGFSGAIYKSFSTKKEALDFIGTKENNIKELEASDNPELSEDYEAITYFDGSSYQGKGGYGYITIIKGEIKKYCGPIEVSTNNIAELTALLKALIKLRNYNTILARGDSLYVINSVTTWYYSWKKNDWQTSTGKTPENLELIKKIVEILETKEVTFEHIRGHRGEKYNEMVDKLANKGRLKAIEEKEKLEYVIEKD